MPLSLPKHRPDRPRRAVQPLERGPREPPLRTYAFDPDAARQAWRQVARTRGARAMRLDGRDPGGRLAPLALGLVAVLAAVLWWTNDDDDGDAPRPAHDAVAAASQNEAPPTARELDRSPDAVDLPPPEPVAMVTPPPPVGAPTFREPVSHEAPPPPTLDRSPPPGTPEQHAAALEKLPHSDQDRAPLGGIGPEGMHVDRITMGTGYDHGTCTGPVGKFSVRTEKVVHLCFRVVHPRMVQRVIVHWERNGKLVRRTFVRIDDSHGYRTRAGLSLRRRKKGDWTARVLSLDGVELASHSFQVL